MELESLQIQITSDAKTADAAIDSLVNRLTALKTALGGFKVISFGSITKSAISANSSLTTFSSTITNLSQNLKIVDNNISILNKQLSGVRIENSVSTSIDAITASMRKLGGKQISSAISNLPKLATGLLLFNKEINGIGALKFDTASLTSFVTSISRLGGKASTQAVANLPRLTVELKNLMNELSKAPAVSENLVRMTEALSRLARTGRSSGTAATSLANSFGLFGNRVNFTRKSAFSIVTTFGKLYTAVWSLARVFGFLKESINISSSLTEVENVVRQTFGKYEKMINDFAKTSIEKYGMSELSVKTFASRFQALGMALDIPQKQMAKMSVRLTALTGDMASFYDVAQSDVAKSLQSIFTGTIKPMRQYSVDFTQATLNEWLMKKGIDANVKSMSQAQKAMVRYYYTLERMEMVTDDFQRTSTTWHNTLAVLHENFKELGKTVGTIAINAFKPFLRALNVVIQNVNSFVETVTSALGSIFGWKFEISKGGASDLADDLNDAYGYMDDLSDAAGSASGNTSGIAKNAKKVKKEIQQATRSFDELKTISKQNNNIGNSSGAGGSGSSGSGSVGQWVETPTKYKEFKSSIKDLEGLGESIRDALVKAVGGIEWDKIYAKASGFGTGLAEFLNGLFSEDKKGNSVFTSTADVIAGALNTAIFASKGFTDKFDFETFGKNVAHGFNRFFKKFKWKQCAEAINGWVDGFWKFVRGFFDDLSWKDVFNGLKTFLNNLTPESIATILMFTGGKLAPIVSSALCSILGFTSGGEGEKGGKTFKLNGLGLAAYIATIAFQLSEQETDFTSSVVEALAAGGAAFYMSGGNPYFALGGVIVSVGISIGKFFVEHTDDIRNFGKRIKKAFMDKQVGHDETGKETVISLPVSFKTFFNWNETSSLFDEAKKNFKTAFDGKRADFMDIGSYILEGILDGFTGALGLVLEPITDFFKWVGDGICEVFGIHSPAKKMKPYGKNIFLGIIEGWKEKISSFSFVKYAKKLLTKIQNAFDSVKNKVVEFKADVKDEAKKWWSNTKSYWSDKVGKVKEFTTGVKDQAKTWWSNTKTWWKERVGKAKEFTTDVKNQSGTWWKNVKSYWSDKVGEVKKFTTDVKKDGSKWWKNVKDEWASSTAGKNVTVAIGFAKNALNNLWSSVTGFFGGKTVNVGTKATKKADGGVFYGGSWKPIKKYAVGGLPNMGQMFVAREAGPELVGTLGGHTAVMNNDQIVSSVSYGVAQAVKEVIQPLVKMGGGNNRPIQISLDGKVIFDSTRQSAKEYFDRTGRSPYPV